MIAASKKVIACSACGSPMWDRGRKRSRRCDGCKEAGQYRARHVDPATAAEREALVLGHLELARKQATSIHKALPRGCGIDRDDILSGAVLGLMDAATRFRSDRGTAFTQFASRRVFGSAMDEIRRMSPAGRRSWEHATQVETVAADVFARTGVRATDEDVAAILGLDADGYTKKFRKGAPSRGRAIGELQIAAPDRATAESDRRDWFETAAKGLGRREKAIVIGIYRDGLTMKEVAQSIGISESRVSQMHAVLLESMKNSPTMKRLLEVENGE